MARILGIDYGLKRCGISVTDPLQIIVSSLTTVETSNLRPFIIEYIKKEDVEKIVLGKPTHKDGTPTHINDDILYFTKFIQKQFEDIIVDFQDESFSSVLAKSIIFQSGAKKKKRQDKALVDKVSAVIILQRYLKHI